MFGSPGLKPVKNEDLRKLLAAVHRGELACPITPIGLAITGLLRLQDDIDLLKGLDAHAVKAVLVAVLRERGA